MFTVEDVIRPFEKNGMPLTDMERTLIERIVPEYTSTDIGRVRVTDAWLDKLVCNIRREMNKQPDNISAQIMFINMAYMRGVLHDLLAKKRPEIFLQLEVGDISNACRLFLLEEKIQKPLNKDERAILAPHIPSDDCDDFRSWLTHVVEQLSSDMMETYIDEGPRSMVYEQKRDMYYILSDALDVEDTDCSSRAPS